MDSIPPSSVVASAVKALQRFKASDPIFQHFKVCSWHVKYEQHMADFCYARCVIGIIATLYSLSK